MLKRLSNRFRKSKEKAKPPVTTPGAAVPYHPDTDVPGKTGEIPQGNDVTPATGNGCAVGIKNEAGGNDVEAGKKLADAAMKGDVATLRKLLKENVAVNSRDEVSPIVTALTSPNIPFYF